HRAPAPGKIFVHILENGDPIVLAQPDPAATHFDLVMAGRIQDTVHDIPLTFEPGTRISAESDNQGSLFVLFGDDVLVYDTKRQGYRMYRLPFSNSPSVSRLGSRLLCGSFNNGL